MREFIHNLRCMINAKKYAKENDDMARYFEWYKYLVVYSIKNFFIRLNFFSKNDEIPF